MRTNLQTKRVEVLVDNGKICLRLIDEWLIEHNFGNDITIDVPDIEMMIAAIQKNVLPGRKYGILVLPESRVDTSREAREHQINNQTDHAFAEAIVISSLPTRLAAYFYYKFYRPKHPYKFFKDKVSAIGWLQEVGQAGGHIGCK